MEPVEYLEECYLPLGMWLQKGQNNPKTMRSPRSGGGSWPGLIGKTNYDLKIYDCFGAQRYYNDIFKILYHEFEIINNFISVSIVIKIPMSIK